MENVELRKEKYWKDVFKSGNELGVSDIYDRRLYDSSRAKRVAMNEAFENKTLECDYTGSLMHSDKVAMNRKYHTNSASVRNRHIAEPDHIVPIEKVHSRYKGNPFLKNENIKEIANLKTNLKVISKTVNNSKLNKTNIEYVSNRFINKGDITTKQAVKMVSDQILSSAIQDVYAVGLTAKNVAQSGLAGIYNNRANIAVSLSVKATEELVAVAQGRKDIKEAGKDMIALGTKLAGSSAIQNIAADGLGSMIKEMPPNKVSGLLKTTRFLKSSNAAMLVTLAVTVGDAAIDFVNGEITAQEFVQHSLLNGGALALNSSIQSLAAGLSLGPGMVAVVVGSILISTVCNYFISNLQNFKEEQNLMRRRVRFANALADEALLEMEKQRNILNNLVSEEFSEWDRVTKEAFENIQTSVFSNDITGLTEGIDKILGLFGENVRFKSSMEVKTSILNKEVFVF